MKEIYHNMKIFTLIILISAVCINLGIIEDFFRMFIILVFLFLFFTNWKLKKITNTKEERYFLLVTLTLSFLFSFLIKKETIFNIPKEYIGFLMAGLVSIVVMKITEFINRGKGNAVK